MPYVDNAAIWIRKDKNGKAYLGFKAARDIKKDETFNFFKNDKGGVETRPDYKSYEKVEQDNLKTAREKLSPQVKESEYTADEVADDVPF